VKPRLFAVFNLVLVCLQGPLGCTNGSTSSRPAPRGTWVLTWHDEFDGPNGAPPDNKKWLVETGGGGWGNHELQYYTARSRNVRLENGKLIIEANREPFTGNDGVRRDYTSARLTTAGRFSQMYGRFEARIRIPSMQGIWPAFWLLGDDYSTKGWPACGEIDIMESFGVNHSQTVGSLHGPGYFSGGSLKSSYTLPKGTFGDAFHVFAVEWEPAVVRFYVDGQLFGTKIPADVPSGMQWIFDHPFFLVLNVAVGGDLPGSPQHSSVFPQRMVVDYVRVYSRGNN
jgi:beta-glucanase (GH16 family)